MNAPAPAHSQDTSLLATKLYIPPPRANLVSRPHLIERLDRGLSEGHRLILISAPAGFGKTTLLSEWTSARIEDYGVRSKDSARGAETLPESSGSVPPTSYSLLPTPGSLLPTPLFSWLSLDEADSTPVRFLTYLLAALHQIDNHIGQDLQSVLRQPRAPSPSASGQDHWVPRAMTSLINDLARFGADQPLVLVLDDYHCICDAHIHGAIELLLDRMPPHLHLVIATRQDPPFSLSRLRARGQMTEIRQRDLCFDMQEAARFFQQVVGLDLAKSDIAVLEERTEGWVAGLQLAALSVQGRDTEDIAHLKAFSGRQAFILDYLTDEVLERQTDSIQRFLLETCLLERLCGPLCDAVLERTDREDPAADNAQAVLETLNRNNLFLIPLDDERQWYRYHRLFRDLLRAGLHEVSAQREENWIPDLHRRAATWYREHNLPADAVHHALLAQDYAQAADIVEQAIQHVSVWSQINVTTFMDWYRALPDDVTRTRPRLQLFASRVCSVSGQPATTEHLLHQITDYLRDQPDHPDAGEILDLVAADRASYAAVRGDVHEAIALTHQILERLPAQNGPMRLRLSSTLGLAHERAGDLDRAGQAFGEAIAAARALGMDFAAVPLVCNQAQIQFLRGQLHQAAETCARAVQLGTVDGTPLPVTGYAEIEQGKILYEQNDLENAAGRVVKGIERLAQGGSPDSFGSAHTVLAQIRQAQGDTQGALSAIETAIQAALDSGISRAIHLTRAYRARIWLAQGKLEQASRWADEYRLIGETAYLREVEDLTLVRVLLAQDKATEAQPLLDDLLAPAEEAGRFGRVLEIEASRALALEALDDRSRALAALAHALRLAAPEGYVRVFVEEGRPMGELLLTAARAPSRASSHIDMGYVRMLLAALSEAPTADPGLASGHQPLVEPLTERELEVLRLLAEGLTNPEIGQRLYISRPTVKTHTQNIYSKLNVHTRREAVEKARALGMLPNT